MHDLHQCDGGNPNNIAIALNAHFICIQRNCFLTTFIVMEYFTWDILNKKPNVSWAEWLQYIFAFWNWNIFGKIVSTVISCTRKKCPENAGGGRSGMCCWIFLLKSMNYWEMLTRKLMEWILVYFRRCIHKFINTRNSLQMEASSLCMLQWLALLCFSAQIRDISQGLGDNSRFLANSSLEQYSMLGQTKINSYP